MPGETAAIKEREGIVVDREETAMVKENMRQCRYTKRELRPCW